MATKDFVTSKEALWPVVFDSQGCPDEFHWSATEGVRTAAVALVAAGVIGGLVARAASAERLRVAQAQTDLCRLLTREEIQAAIGRAVDPPIKVETFHSAFWGDGYGCAWPDPTLHDDFRWVTTVGSYELGGGAQAAFETIKARYVGTSAVAIGDLGYDAFVIGERAGITANLHLRLRNVVMTLNVVTKAGIDPIHAAERLARIALPNLPNEILKAWLKQWQKNQFRRQARELTYLSHREAAAAAALTIGEGDTQITTPPATALATLAAFHRQEAFKLQNLAADPPTGAFGRCLGCAPRVSIAHARKVT